MKNNDGEKKTEMQERLKNLRQGIMFAGVKISAVEFARMLGISIDKLRNFENGRTKLSVELLQELYFKGINPIYILTGEGSKFADNSAGRKFSESTAKTSSEIEINSGAIDLSHISDDQLFQVFRAAAGNIEKRLARSK